MPSESRPLPYRAPAGKFRVFGKWPWSDDWDDGDFDTIMLARDHVATKTAGEQMLEMCIYDDQGNQIS